MLFICSKLSERGSEFVLWSLNLSSAVLSSSGSMGFKM